MDTQLRNAIILAIVAFYFTRDLMPTLVIGGASYLINAYL